MWTLDPWQIGLAVFLDFMLGDPRWMPHLTRFSGWLAKVYEKAVVRFMGRTVYAGILFWLLVCGSLLTFYWFIVHAFFHLEQKLLWSFEIIVVYQSIAARDLHRHVQNILRPLQDQKLDEARVALSKIVGRDTQCLNETEISRATIESVAESANDGFVAPLFWAVILGAPGALLYRIVNTLDSLYGHRDEQNEKFGKFSARMDDGFNWIPARLCAVISMGWSGMKNFGGVFKEAVQHASPNAGWTEAAAAYALNVRLGGGNRYQGEWISGPIFNPNGALTTDKHISASLNWFWKIVGLSIILAITAIFLIKFINENSIFAKISLIS